MKQESKYTLIVLKNGFRYTGTIIPCSLDGFCKIECRGKIQTINLDSIERMEELI